MVFPDAPLLHRRSILSHGLEFTYGTGSRTTMRGDNDHYLYASKFYDGLSLEDEYYQ
jgi:hypothetical protein